MRQFFFVSLLLISRAFALDVDEVLPNVKILATHPGNIVVLNRGLEDGVLTGSHAKLRGTAGYAARGICVKSGMMASHWRLYRIVDPNLVSQDLSYSLIGMDASEVAPQAVRYQDTVEDKGLPTFDETKLPGAPVAPAQVDLPKDLSQDKDFYRRGEKPVQSVGKLAEPSRLRQDMRHFNGSVFASPWSVQKGPANVESVRLGARLANDGKTYRAQAGIDHTVLATSLEKDGEDFSMRSTEAFGNFTVKDYWAGWDVNSELIYRQARYGGEYAPRSQYLIAPLGLTVKAAEGTTIKRLELSYAPTFDTREHTGERSGVAFSEQESGVRHGVRLFFLAQLTPEFSITNDLRWRPMHNSEGIQTSDSLTHERFLASWRLIGPLNVDYEFQWMDDAQLRRISGLPRVITTNSVNVRLDFNL